MGGGLERLPVLSLLQLAVTRHHDHATVAAKPALGKRDPPPSRCPSRAIPSSPRYRGPRCPGGRRAPRGGGAAAGVPSGQPRALERRVEPRHVVALRREEDVALGSSNPRSATSSSSNRRWTTDVEGAEGRAEVARPCTLHGHERVQAARVREQRELRVGVDVRRTQAISSGFGTRSRSGMSDRRP